MERRHPHYKHVVQEDPWPLGLVPNRDQDTGEMKLNEITSNIKVPYAREIPSKLRPGSVVNIVGTVHPKGGRFAVNLSCGMKSDADVAFHFNPRFHQDYVVRNSYVGKHWQEEEVLGYQRNPFKLGTSFFLAILVAEDCYMVSVNGKTFCSFGHRLNYNLVNTLKIEGGVILEKIEHRCVNIFPEPCPLKPNLFETVDSLNDTKDRPLELPLTVVLPKAFTVGKEIEISGQMKMLPIAFFINLQSGYQSWPHPQIALHVNPRFISLGGTLLVRNSWLSGEWGKEEHTHVYYLRPGRSFVINVKCEQNEYVLKIDGFVIGTYRHRIKPDIVNTVYVQGDIFLHDVKIIGS